MELEVYTPFGNLLKQTNIDYISIPSASGEIGILPGHIPLITTIETGVLTYTQAGKTHNIAVHHGFAHVAADNVKICTKIAETGDNIDRERAQQAYDRAKEAMDKLLKEVDYDKKDYNRLQSKLNRATTRTNI